MKRRARQNAAAPRPPTGSTPRDDSPKIDEALVAVLLATAADGGPPPPPEDPVVRDNGVTFMVLAGPRMWMIEAWVRALAAALGAPVDWSFSGGRAGVDTLPEYAAQAIRLAKAMVPSLAAAAERAEARGDDGAFRLVWGYQAPPPMVASDDDAERPQGSAGEPW